VPKVLATPVVLAHLLVGQVLQPGDCAVDATAGNGHDTLYLAQRVGDRGKVYAFDVQQEAILQTAARLRAGGFENRVVLIQAGHERLKEFVPAGIKAAMFNLGYLPGGDHRRIVTRPDTTLAALEQVLDLLDSGGLVTVVVYRGHEGGEEEGEAVSQFAKSLSFKQWDVIITAFPNRSPRAPFLVAMQKTDPREEGRVL
jgi:ubiquinone/menaquinone biosynthesis C-methylase UbiE